MGEKKNVDKPVLRVLLDTSAYSFFASGNEPELWKKVAETGKCVFYGFELVRKELAETPKTLKHEKKVFRQVLLEYYDSLVGNYSFENNFLIESIAKQYLRNYKGNKSLKKLKTDFTIVACASFHGLDILVSEDQSTLMSKSAVTAYKKVNSLTDGLVTPKFYTARKLAELV